MDDEMAGGENGQVTVHVPGLAEQEYEVAYENATGQGID